MNIIDVGAGMTKYYQQWLSQYPTLRIFAIEPHYALFAKLEQFKKTLLLNHSNSNHSDPNQIILLNCVITSSNETELPFYINNDPNSSSTLKLNNNNVSKWKHPIGRKRLCTTNVVNITNTTINDLIENHNIYYIDLLNIDVQGNSMDVLQGIKQEYYNKIKQINIKLHDIEYELYQNQTRRDQIETHLNMRFFSRGPKTKKISQDQEIILIYFNDIMKTKKAILFFQNFL